MHPTSGASISEQNCLGSIFKKWLSSVSIWEGHASVIVNYVFWLCAWLRLLICIAPIFMSRFVFCLHSWAALGAGKPFGIASLGMPRLSRLPPNWGCWGSLLICFFGFVIPWFQIKAVLLKDFFCFESTWNAEREKNQRVDRYTETNKHKTAEVIGP